VQLPKVLGSTAKELLREFVKFGEIKNHPSLGSVSSITRSYSANNNEHPNNRSIIKNSEGK
jgi:hypothetical protein